MFDDECGWGECGWGEKGIEGKVHVFQLLPTHLGVRNFKVPADASFGLEHQDEDAPRDRPLKEMTMAQIVAEVRSLRAQLAEKEVLLQVEDLAQGIPPAQKEENERNETYNSGAGPAASPLVPPQAEAADV